MSNGNGRARDFYRRQHRLIKNEADIIKVIEEDDWMMGRLRTVRTLNLPDWWICAGFVRSKIWDYIHHIETRTPLPDIDVIYFDSENINEFEEKQWETYLRSMDQNAPWSVKNQARMHRANNAEPYTSSVDGISKFPETVTALGVKLNKSNHVVLSAPWGVDDVIRCEVRPTPIYIGDEKMMAIYRERVLKKNWKKTWGKLVIEAV